MSGTTVSPNNAKIAYRGRAERERSTASDSAMPVVSKAQNGAMHAAAEGKSTLGIPKKVGAEFVRDQQPGSVKKLPRHVKRKVNKLKREGLISEKAAQRIG